MTVQELFDHFDNWFNRLTYQISPVATGEFRCIEEKYPFEETVSFQSKFKDYIVEEWEYLNSDNAMYLLIREK